MGYFVLNGRVRKWVEGEEPNSAVDKQCKRIYENIKVELNDLIADGYEAEFIKYKAARILTLSRENDKVISFVFQFIDDKLTVYIYTMEARIFVYHNGFLRKALQIISE